MAEACPHEDNAHSRLPFHDICSLPNDPEIKVVGAAVQRRSMQQHRSWVVCSLLPPIALRRNT
jgi:hypothetical protein